MADALKKFFKKKKVDSKFRKAGPGQKLSDESAPTRDQANTPSVSQPRGSPSEEVKQAAAAALARLQPTKSTGYSKSMHVPQSFISKPDIKPSSSSVDKQSSKADIAILPSKLAATGVYFRCPLISEEVLSQSEWKTKIKNYLYEQLEHEQGLTACLIIKNCNKKEKADLCIDTLCKCLRNIITEPEEEKYRKIRMSNKLIQERVLPVNGASEFLNAAGFVKKTCLHQDKEEDFLVMDKCENTENLEILIDGLRDAEVIPLELDRNLQVFSPVEADDRSELPQDFFRLTLEEIKKEQETKSDLAESALMLRTKAMREKQERKEMRKYRYALIRVRFPDNILLQGTFGVYEKFEEVVKFVSENTVDCNFILSTVLGQVFGEEEYGKTLIDLHLVPATVVVFKSTEQSTRSDSSYLKPEVAMLVTPTK